jgi:hypothetical protein
LAILKRNVSLKQPIKLSRPRRGEHPSPLVVDPVKTAETLGFEKPSFIYSRSEDPIQKDTILLNYCIGDIEKFRGDIESSKSGLSNNDFQATDFFGIFQKFKLSFNLLVRIKLSSVFSELAIYRETLTSFTVSNSFYY